jgi:hypothetical protein
MRAVMDDVVHHETPHHGNARQGEEDLPVAAERPIVEERRICRPGDGGARGGRALVEDLDSFLARFDRGRRGVVAEIQRLGVDGVGAPAWDRDQMRHQRRHIVALFVRLKSELIVGNGLQHFAGVGHLLIVFGKKGFGDAHGSLLGLISLFVRLIILMCVRV